MKILEERAWLVFRCSNCRSQIEAEPQDVKKGSKGANYGGDHPEVMYYVACPKCGEVKEVPNSKLTSHIEDLAKKKKR